MRLQAVLDSDNIECFAVFRNGETYCEHLDGSRVDDEARMKASETWRMIQSEAVVRQVFANSGYTALFDLTLHPHSYYVNLLQNMVYGWKAAHELGRVLNRP